MCCGHQAAHPLSRTSLLTEKVCKQLGQPSIPCLVAKEHVVASLTEERVCSGSLKPADRDTSHIRLPVCLPVGGTRTCIHTPGAGFAPEEMTKQLIDEIIKVGHCDGMERI